MVFLGWDHGGATLGTALERWLLRQGIAVAVVRSPRSGPRDDYPPVSERVARTVREHPYHRGVLLCRSGVGMALVANKLPGVRAAVGWDVRAARAARVDEDTNVLALPADRLTPTQARAIVAAFLTTPFSGAARHRRRLRELARIDARYRRSRG